MSAKLHFRLNIPADPHCSNLGGFSNREAFCHCPLTRNTNQRKMVKRVQISEGKIGHWKGWDRTFHVFWLLCQLADCE